MKIGILTLHQSMNYGALLQAYALKKTLENYGEVNVINYDYLYNIGPHYVDMGGIEELYKSDLYQQFAYAQIEQGNAEATLNPLIVIDKFNRFKMKSLNLTKLLKKDDFFNEQLEDFDVIVSGSDQIWNEKPKRGIDWIFYQTFPTSARKIAYAASIAGWQFSKEEKTLIKKHLQSFKAISLREKKDIAEFEAITGRKIESVIDPVFLLNTKQWETGKEIVKKKQYLLVYKPINPNISWFVEGYERIAKKLGLEVVYVAQRGYSTLYPKDVPDPMEFVSLFANASFVYTNSFHGVAFSILFNKPFAVTFFESTFNRIANILDITQIKNRILFELEDVETLCYEIDYEEANRLIEAEVKKSKQFIYDAMS